MSSIQQKFYISWFIPAILKYKKLPGQVLLASFFIQLFALVTPLFFQVVVDKVLVHQGLIQDWYTDSGQQLDEIRTDYAVLQADMVDNFVNAMAAFGAPPAGDFQLPQEVRDEIAPVIAANWKAG